MVDNGFSADLTQLMLQGLTTNHYPIIEFGNAKGIGASDKGFPAPLSNEEHLKLAQPFLNKAEIGMFLNAKRYEAANIELAASYDLGFIRCESGMNTRHRWERSSVPLSRCKNRPSTNVPRPQRREESRDRRRSSAGAVYGVIA